MTKSIHTGSDIGTGGSTVNTTQYWMCYGSTGYTTTTEANAQQTVSSDGTYSKMGVNVENSGGLTTTFRFRKNGADGNQVISATGGVFGFFEDASNTDAVTTGDLICIKSVPGATGTFYPDKFIMTFTPT